MPHWFPQWALQPAVMNKSLSYKTLETPLSCLEEGRRRERKRDKERQADTLISSLKATQMGRVGDIGLTGLQRYEMGEKTGRVAGSVRSRDFIFSAQCVIKPTTSTSPLLSSAAVGLMLALHPQTQHHSLTRQTWPGCCRSRLPTAASSAQPLT